MRFHFSGDEFQIHALYAECSPQGYLHLEVLHGNHVQIPFLEIQSHQEMVQHGSSLKGHAKKLHGAGRHGHHASNILRDTLRYINSQASIRSCFQNMDARVVQPSFPILFKQLHSCLLYPALGTAGRHPCADEEIPPQQRDCGQESWNL